MACRDCPRCTEAFIMRLFLLPFRLLHWALTFWNARLFQRWCPECGHRLVFHQKLKDGRFAD